MTPIETSLRRSDGVMFGGQDLPVAPLCERCGAPKTTGFSSHGPSRKSWYCRPCVQALRQARAKPNEPAEPPICVECGFPKERLNAGRGRGQYWGCRPCRNRKSLEAYQARKAGGMALSSFKAVEALAIQAEARKAPPKPERPPGTCWREHRDYWQADHHLRGTTLEALRAAADALVAKGGRR